MRIVTQIHIDRAMEEVFDFLTTPGNWPRWHPSSLGVRGAVDHSLDVGEQVTEEYRVAGQTGTAVWTVRERAAPVRWVIDGVAESGNEATITYTLTGDPHGTQFHRELELTKLPALDPKMDRTAFQRVVDEESTEALRRLKKVLEGPPP
jgi:uncharacterized protein YndB with AHSA1/START domain